MTKMSNFKYLGLMILVASYNAIASPTGSSVGGGATRILACKNANDNANRAMSSSLLLCGIEIAGEKQKCGVNISACSCDEKKPEGTYKTFGDQWECIVSWGIHKQ